MMPGNRELPPGCLPSDIEGPQESDDEATERYFERGDAKLDLQEGDVDERPAMTTESVNEASVLLADALRGLIKLLDDGDLVRNVDGDGDVMAFMRQGIKIASALRAALKALELEKSERTKSKQEQPK